MQSGTGQLVLVLLHEFHVIRRSILGIYALGLIVFSVGGFTGILRLLLFTDFCHLTPRLPDRFGCPCSPPIATAVSYPDTGVTMYDANSVPYATVPLLPVCLATAGDGRPD